MNQEQLFIADSAPSGSGNAAEGPLDGVVCRVLVDVSGYGKELDYLLAPQLKDTARIGSVVRVKLRGRTIKGWITGLDLDSSSVSASKLQPILAVTSIGPSPEVVELSRWVSDHFFGPMRRVLASATPSKQIKSQPKPKVQKSPRSSVDWVRRVEAHTISHIRTHPEDNYAELCVELAKAGQSLVIVPMQHQVDAMVGTLRRNGIAASSYESDWGAGLRGDTLVGTGKAALASLQDPKYLIVLDSHSTNYKMQQAPHWDVRTVLSRRAEASGASLVLASPIPSVEDIAGAQSAQKRALGRDERSKVVLLDTGDDATVGSDLFSSQLINEMRDSGSGVVIINRKGGSRLMYCATCNSAIRSETSDDLMVEDEGELVSPATGERRPLVCQNCGSTHLKKFRLGVKNAAAQLEALVGEPVEQIVADSPPAGEANYYVGTSAALSKRLPVKTVAFVDLDSDLANPVVGVRHKMAEQLISARRLLSRNGGTVFVQTSQPKSSFSNWLSTGDFDSIVNQETDIRSRLKLSPFGTSARISGEKADAIADLMRSEGIAVIGPNNGAYLATADDRRLVLEALKVARASVGGRFRAVLDSVEL